MQHPHYQDPRGASSTGKRKIKTCTIAPSTGKQKKATTYQPDDLRAKLSKQEFDTSKAQAKNQSINFHAYPRELVTQNVKDPRNQTQSHGRL